MKSTCYLALTLALPLGASAAQETSSLQPGTRVRVTTRDSRVVGALDSIDSATIVVRQNGTAIKLSTTPGTRVDISAGPGTCSSDRRGRCVVIGLLGGAALGVGVGAIAESSCGYCGGQVIPFTLAAGVLVGTILGAVVGGEHWHRVELPVRMTLAPDVRAAPRPWHTLRVGVSLTF